MIAKRGVSRSSGNAPNVSKQPSTKSPTDLAQTRQKTLESLKGFELSPDEISKFTNAYQNNANVDLANVKNKHDLVEVVINNTESLSKLSGKNSSRGNLKGSGGIWEIRELAKQNNIADFATKLNDLDDFLKSNTIRRRIRLQRLSIGVSGMSCVLSTLKCANVVKTDHQQMPCVADLLSSCGGFAIGAYTPIRNRRVKDASKKAIGVRTLSVENFLTRTRSNNYKRSVSSTINNFMGSKYYTYLSAGLLAFSAATMGVSLYEIGSDKL